MKPSYGREKKSAKTLFSIILSVYEESKVRKKVEEESGVNPSYLTKILKKREDIFEIEKIPGLIPRSDSRQKIRLKLEEHLEDLLEIGDFNKQEKTKITNLVLNNRKAVVEFFHDIEVVLLQTLVLEHPIEFLEDPIWYFIAYNHLRLKYEFYENFVIEVQFGKMFAKTWSDIPLDKPTIQKFQKTVKEYVKSGAFKSYPLRFVVKGLPGGKEFKIEPENFFPEEE